MSEQMRDYECGRTVNINWLTKIFSDMLDVKLVHGVDNNIPRDNVVRIYHGIQIFDAEQMRVFWETVRGKFNIVVPYNDDVIPTPLYKDRRVVACSAIDEAAFDEMLGSTLYDALPEYRETIAAWHKWVNEEADLDSIHVNVDESAPCCSAKLIDAVLGNRFLDYITDFVPKSRAFVDDRLLVVVGMRQKELFDTFIEKLYQYARDNDGEGYEGGSY